MDDEYNQFFYEEGDNDNDGENMMFFPYMMDDEENRDDDDDGFYMQNVQPEPYDTIECLYENRLELKGNRAEIRRFLDENKHPTSGQLLSLHTGRTQQELDALPHLWVSIDKDNCFLSEAFDVEWVEPLSTYLFRTIYVVPDVWLKEVSKRYPQLRFTLIHADSKQNRSEEFKVRNGTILRHNTGTYCNYWQPYCEECDEQIATSYNEFYVSYFCNRCNDYLNRFIPPSN